MTTQGTKMAGSRPSFATIAARAPPSHNGPTIVGRENEKPPKSPSPSHTTAKAPSIANNPSASQMHQDLQNSMSRLTVKAPLPPSSTLNEQAKTNIKRAGLSLDDDHAHISSSSTKAASLDGRSTTSGTTFALDEKESLRPDDSASVKASEDEDFGSGPASGAPNSGVGSEAGSRAFRDQFNEITESFGPGNHRSHPLSRKVIAGIEEEGPPITHPPLVSAPLSPMHLPRPDIPAVAQPPMTYEYREPDEKLFEALDSPKDRMFLLRLEQDIITFVNDSTEPKIDLPPCNSFCRLLAHKLADYYALTHWVDNAVSSVTLYRTPYCRTPTPLSTLAKTHPSAILNDAPAAPKAMTIMRRPGLGKDGQSLDSGPGTTDSSVAPSKAGSEVGEESQQGTGVASPAESNPAKDKATMTREEREARYKEKREELFGPQSENADSTEAVNEVSRTSSRNEKKKKKQKNNDDGFEARSQFNAYYPTMQYPSNTYDHTPNPAAYFNPYPLQPGNTMGQQGPMGPAMLQQGFQHGYQSVVNAQGYPAAPNQSSMMNGFNGHPVPGYNQQTPTQFYSVMHQGIGVGQQSPAMTSPAICADAQLSRPQSQMSDQQWSQNNYSQSYQQPREQHQHVPATVPSVPYQFGQLPFQSGMQSGKAQHPLPGSYNRQPFNPQSRAFVPNHPLVSSQTPPYGNNAGHSLMRNPAAPFPNGNPYASYSPQAPAYPQLSSMQMSGAYNAGQDPKNYSTRKGSGQSNGPHSNDSPSQNSLSKWGTPANLPPKPPPPEIPSVPEAQHSLPMNNQFNVNVQPHIGGQPMPSYQNGVYSMPGMGSQ